MSRAVIDQPGIRIIVIGLLLSVFLGLALSTQISQTRIQAYLNKSIELLHPDFYVDYATANIHLSRWGLPFPALVIQEIRMSPRSTLCQSSQIFIDELEIPVSILTILGFSKAIEKIRINQVELRLSDIDRCLVVKKTGSKTINNSNITSESIVTNLNETDLKDIFSNKANAELKEIYIDKLKVISNYKTDQPVLLRQLNLDLFYVQNYLSELRIRSKINALKDARSDVYFLNSDLVAILRNVEGNQIESVIEINGKLLDGDVRFFSHSFTGSNKISYELGLKRVSIKVLTPIIDNYNFSRSINLEKTPISISFFNTGKIFLSEKVNTDAKFKNIQINVESGSLTTDELELSYTDDKFTIKPFELVIRSIPLSSLKNIESLKSKLDSFDSLGDLSGNFKYKNEKLYKASGVVKGARVIFSNRSRRDIQSIDQIDIEVSRSENKTKFSADNFVLNNEKVAGYFWALYDAETLGASGQLKVSDIKLNDRIWDQFTLVEQSPKLEVLWNYRKDNKETHDVAIQIDKVALPGLKLEKLKVDIHQIFSKSIDENRLSVMIKPEKLSADRNFLQQDAVKQVLNSKNGFKFDNLNSKRTSLSLFGTNWKNINFKLNSYFLSELSAKSDTHLIAEGTVKHEKGLMAELVLQNRKSVFKFNLLSNQDEKVIIKPVL